jgi:hypothetical protein
MLQFSIMQIVNILTMLTATNINVLLYLWHIVHHQKVFAIAGSVDILHL